MPSSITSAHRKRKLAHWSFRVIAAGLLISGALLAWDIHEISLRANPASSFAVEQPDCGDAFPKVDWKSLKKTNADAIAWISIPGTSVSHPVMLESTDAKGYYLSHDAYGGANPCGVPYVAAESYGPDTPVGWIIYGHHMRDGSMFACLAQYEDEEWTRQHSTVLLQTTESKWYLEVVEAESVDASHTRWEASNEYCLLCTCSYGTYANQRTLVKCIPHLAQ